MTRVVTVLGYAVIAACAVALELAARRSGRLARFADALELLVRPAALRLMVLAGWLWLGWHVFVRVRWR